MLLMQISRNQKESVKTLKYLKIIHYCQLMYWGTVLKYMNSRCSFSSCYIITMAISIKKYQNKLELLNDIDILLMVEKSIRDQICHFFIDMQKLKKKNNRLKYKKGTISQDVLGCKYVFGWTMSQRLPVSSFKWVENAETHFQPTENHLLARFHIMKVFIRNTSFKLIFNIQDLNHGLIQKKSIASINSIKILR